jgi:hypothetical protein
MYHIKLFSRRQSLSFECSSKAADRSETEIESTIKSIRPDKQKFALTTHPHGHESLLYTYDKRIVIPTEAQNQKYTQ